MMYKMADMVPLYRAVQLSGKQVPRTSSYLIPFGDQT